MSTQPEARFLELGELAAVVARQGVSTRADLGRFTGLGRATISQRVNSLLTLGVLVDAGDGTSAGGRRPGLLALNPDAGIVLAADIGANHARVAAASLSGRILAETSADFDLAVGPRTALAGLVERFHTVIEQSGSDPSEVRGIGIGVPGPVEFKTGTVVKPPIMPGWDGLVLPEVLADHFDAAILVDNEVNLMALGEYWARELVDEQLLVVKVATGIGCGIITNGVVHRGADGAAGDIGHVRVNYEGEVLCSCGNVNCLEAVASGAAIARQLLAEGARAHATADVVALAQEGDLRAVRRVRSAGERIGEVLAALVNFYNPTQIVVAGTLSDLHDDLLAGVRSMIYQRALPLATRRLTIETSSLEHRSGILGGVLLATQGALSPSRISRWVASAPTTT
jgi:predicted NBD/HSP70 family sugar kinase